MLSKVINSYAGCFIGGWIVGTVYDLIIFGQLDVVEPFAPILAVGLATGKYADDHLDARLRHRQAAFTIITLMAIGVFAYLAV